jgi:hypothetical protein
VGAAVLVLRLDTGLDRSGETSDANASDPCRCLPARGGIFVSIFVATMIETTIRTKIGLRAPARLRPQIMFQKRSSARRRDSRAERGDFAGLFVWKVMAGTGNPVN